MERLKDEIIYIKGELYKGFSNKYIFGCLGCYFLSHDERGFVRCTKPKVVHYGCNNIIYEKI